MRRFFISLRRGIMADFTLTLIAPERYKVDTFETDPSIWSETDDAKTTASRNTSETFPRDSVMQILGHSWTLGDGITLGDGYYLGDSPDGAGEGAYKDFTVTAGVRYLLNGLYRMDNGAVTIELYDQTNGASITSTAKTETSWSAVSLTAEAPAGCNTIRVKFLQKNDTIRSGPYLLDDVSLNGNILLYDPDTYRRIPERVGSFHQTLGGRRIYDLRAIHYALFLGWNFIESDQYENLREIFYSNELLYFDDGEVPSLVESDTVYDTATFNFVGITNPSSTHKAYSDSSSSLPSAESDFETTEFSTADYEAVDGDDNNYKETTNPDADKFLYHKLTFVSSIAQADVQRFRIKIVMSANDSSPQTLDGGVLYAWNQTSWVELTRVTSSAKTDMNYSTVEAEIAKSFVDPVDSYVRLILRSRNRRIGTNDLSLRTYFAECEVNEGLDLTIDLSHKCILDGDDDVIWVKNLTQATTLTLDDDYAIASDRRSITVTGQDSGDIIEVKFDRHFEVMFASIPGEWFNRDTDSPTLERKAEITLETLSESR